MPETCGDTSTDPSILCYIHKLADRDLDTLSRGVRDRKHPHQQSPCASPLQRDDGCRAYASMSTTLSFGVIPFPLSTFFASHRQAHKHTIVHARSHHVVCMIEHFCLLGVGFPPRSRLASIIHACAKTVQYSGRQAASHGRKRLIHYTTLV